MRATTHATVEGSAPASAASVRTGTASDPADTVSGAASTSMPNATATDAATAHPHRDAEGAYERGFAAGFTEGRTAASA